MSTPTPQQRKQWALNRRAKGLCLRCPATSAKTLCPECMEDKNNAESARKNREILSGKRVPKRRSQIYTGVAFLYD